MKNVLIPTDFSDNSQNAIRFALEYFADVPVNFFILHVSLPNSSRKERAMETLYESSEENESGMEVSELLEAEISSCKLLAKNSQHQFYSVQEKMLLVEAIRKEITKNDIDLILMGTKGDSTLDQRDVVSNTYDVITKVKCPIMVIPENARFDAIRNIAFVTDYNCLYRNNVVSNLSNALNLHSSPLRVLHIRSKNSSLTPAQVDNKGFLHYFFKDFKHSFHFLENNEVEMGIQDFVDTWEISMVAIAAKNLNFIQRLMLRPNSEVINYHSEIPFLVLHE